MQRQSQRQRQGITGGRGRARGGVKRTAAAIEPRRGEQEARDVPRVPAGTTPSHDADEAWAIVLAKSRELFPGPALAWLEQLRSAGEADGKLAVEGPADAVSWARRRYGKLLGELVREHTGFDGLWIGVEHDRPKPVEAF